MKDTKLSWTKSAPCRAIQNFTTTSHNATTDNGEYHLFQMNFSRGRIDETFGKQFNMWARKTFELSFRASKDDDWTPLADPFKSLKDAKAHAQQHANQ